MRGREGSCGTTCARSLQSSPLITEHFALRLLGPFGLPRCSATMWHVVGRLLDDNRVKLKTVSKPTR